jgi:hypothetical protein
MVVPTDRFPVSFTCSRVIAVAAEQAWGLVRDFNAMPAWNTTVRQSHIEDGPPDRVGCRRVLVFDDGGVWTHRLTGLSDVDMKLQYSIVGTPEPMRIPVWNYHAEMRIIPGGGGVLDAAHPTCTVEWRAEFETAHADDMKARASQVFEAGLSGLRRRLES